MANCPLCGSNHIESYFSNKDSKYLICSECELVFSPDEFHLNETEEKSRYDLHRNNPKDERYRKFLSKIFNPVLRCLSPGDVGLDFGSGPGPTLSLMFSEQGYKVDLFDKFYANNESIFNNKYNFITSSEVVEHLDNPGVELNRLFNMLDNGGVLAIMTQMLSSDINFSSWHYKDDPTHVCFFSKNTMKYLAKSWQVDVSFYGDDVALFFK